jgi:N-acylneuraminate cytidylyltransferase
VIGQDRLLAVIPARGGSKGVPRKNVRVVAGLPLIAWTLKAARESRFIDTVMVSTDDHEIANVARAHGGDVPFMRDARLASDEAPTMDVVLDVLQRCPGYGWVILLQPTSPLRQADDIDAAIKRCLAANAPSCVSICSVQESPYWMYSVSESGHMKPLMPPTELTRRQDLPPIYSLNGAIYLARVDWLLRERTFVRAETIAHEMPVERSLDIDTESDLLQLKTHLER